MAQPLSETDQLLEIRVALEDVLQVLDKKELHLPAIHIAMALSELGKMRDCWPTSFLRVPNLAQQGQ